MAISICFGLLAATCLTLLYVPALYLIVRDVRNLVVARFRRAEEGPGFAGEREHTAADRDPMTE
jgi:hypothetical protein